MNDTKLWDANHPYYAQQGNFLGLGYHINYGSWKDFIEEEGDLDFDLNLVYRWDWVTPDPEVYGYRLKEDPNYELPSETLKIFYIGQRKALARSVEIAVTREDEPAIREFLTKRAEHMRDLWSPLL